MQGPALIEETKRRAIPFSRPKQIDSLIRKLARRRIVMLGEASHGTHEFYEWRKYISQVLIQDYGFHFIAVEGDWPPCWEVNEYIQGRNHLDARAALSGFHRWPTWMWANSDILDLIRWMRIKGPAGFYGLDVYSLFESLDLVLARAQEVDPRLARELRERYECFTPYQRDEKAYARALLKLPEGCASAVLENLKALLQVRADKPERALFDARQNARIVANAENYYRTMVQGTGDSWNVRDTHMIETLQVLLNHHGPDSKAIVWAHNTHIGDHRATDMVAHGHVNIGGLAREAWREENVALVGFGTHHGEVIASHAWGAPAECMEVPPGRAGSLEDTFHEAAQALGTNAFALDFEEVRERDHVFREIRGHRAIGVVYNPDHERLSNYVPTSLSSRYDAFLFFDETTALQPLVQSVDRSEMPETWPQGV